MADAHEGLTERNLLWEKVCNPVGLVTGKLEQTTVAFDKLVIFCLTTGPMFLLLLANFGPFNLLHKASFMTGVLQCRLSLLSLGTLHKYSAQPQSILSCMVGLRLYSL